MTVTKSLNIMRELAMEFPHKDRPWEERPSFQFPPTRKAVDQYEKLGGFAIPEELKVFYSEVGAVVAMSVHNGYWIGGIEELSRSVLRDDFPDAINGIPVIPVATDGGGNAFLIDARGQIWLWSHETQEVKVVAKDFASFLERVVDDFRACHLNTPEWSYLT